MKSGNDIQKLTEAVSTLNTALAASNKRTALLERVIRWGAVGLVAVATIVVSVVNEVVDTAYASEVKTVHQNADSVIQALNNINNNLMVFGQMGQMMNVGFQEAAQRENIQKAIAEHMKEHPGVNEQQAMMALAGGVMADAFVVMHRVREDSDLVHPLINQQNLGKVMETIAYELKLMNQALQAVPYMAGNMGAMTHNMRKMGSWVPWAP